MLRLCRGVAQSLRSVENVRLLVAGHDVYPNQHTRGVVRASLQVAPALTRAYASSTFRVR